MVGDLAAPAAYKVAAGVINPVTGRWMTKSCQIDSLLPCAEQFYREIEACFDIEIYYPIPLLRYCQNADDAKRLGRRMRNPRYANVLGAYHPPGSGHPSIHDPAGCFEIKGAAYVDLPTCIRTLQTEFVENDRLLDASFDHLQLAKIENGWRYQNITAKRVIFCEGIGIQNNPWFADLPLAPAKGETLLLKAPKLQLPNTLYHHKKWLLPYGNHEFRVGATYDETDLNPEPTPEGSAQLLDAVREFLVEDIKLKIDKHLAGIRPSTKDARPLLGTHPAEPNLHLFNGLGSKGTSLAPEMARILIEHIFQGKALAAEIDLNRLQPCA